MGEVPRLTFGDKGHTQRVNEKSKYEKRYSA